MGLFLLCHPAKNNGLAWGAPRQYEGSNLALLFWPVGRVGFALTIIRLDKDKKLLADRFSMVCRHFVPPDTRQNKGAQMINRVMAEVRRELFCTGVSA
jgi:hypothetical protein